MSDNAPVVITRIFKAPVEKIWAAWTEPEQMKKWWGPQDFTAPFIEQDLRVGGRYLYAMHGPAGTPFDMDMWSSGTFEEIVPFKKLVCTDHFSDKNGNAVSPAAYGMADFPEELMVTIEFESLPDGTTKMTLTHTGAPAGKHADDMKQGWNQSFDKLAASVEG